MQDAFEFFNLLPCQTLLLHQGGEEWGDLPVEKSVEQGSACHVTTMIFLHQWPEKMLAAHLVVRQRSLLNQSTKQGVNGLRFP